MKKHDSDLLNELYSMPKSVVEKAPVAAHIPLALKEQALHRLKADGLQVKDLITAAFRVYVESGKKTTKVGVTAQKVDGKGK